MLLAACADEPGPTIRPLLPTATAVPQQATVVAATPEPPQPSPTVSTDEVDPNVGYTPGSTVAGALSGTPRPRLTSSPTLAPVYGSLPPPPRTLTPQTIRPASARSPLPKDTFVVATSSGLYLLNSDGQNDRTLVNGAAFASPKIAPDALHIAVFRTEPISLRQQLYLIDSQGTAQLVGGEGGVVQHFVWSPDSKTLALTRASDSNNDGLTDEMDKANIWLYEIATGKQQMLAEGRNPAWSSDGMRLAYLIPGPPSDAIDPTTHKPRRSPNALGVYNIAAKVQRILISSKGLELALGAASEDPAAKGRSLSLRYFKQVSWHPDSKHITASADATNPDGLKLGLIITLTIDEAIPRLLTAGGDAVSLPVWSPDGKRLAYETEPQFPLSLNSKSGQAIGVLDSPDFAARPTRIFVGDPSTRNYTRAPRWLNQGQQLAFLKGDDTILAVADADGKNERNLISGCTGFDWV